MPNWCVQNWILRGPKEDVQRFYDTVNSCLVTEGYENGFGKFWLGNLYTAFGYGDDLETINYKVHGLRGTFDPDEEQMATLPCPDAEERRISPTVIDDDTSEIRFSVTHAWGTSEWFQDMVDEKFPSLYQAWRAMDEFGNFHSCRNGKEFGLGKYEVEGWGDLEVYESFDEGEEQCFIDCIKDATDGELVFTLDELKDENEFYTKLNDWNEKHEDDNVELIVRFWEEE